VADLLQKSSELKKALVSFSSVLLRSLELESFRQLRRLLRMMRL
jgi:hypothetical protein